MAENQNAPLRIAIVGEVISKKEMLKVNFIDSKTGESKFGHDCYLIRVDPLDGRPMQDVYVTFDQWDKYGMNKVLFEGNIVNIAMDQCVAGETGYIDRDTEEFVYHTKSYNAFAGADNVGRLGLIGVFAKQGVTPSIVSSFIEAIDTERRKMALKYDNKPEVAGEVADEPAHEVKAEEPKKSKADTKATTDAA